MNIQIFEPRGTIIVQITTSVQTSSIVVEIEYLVAGGMNKP